MPFQNGLVVHLKSSQKNKGINEKKAVPELKLFTTSSSDIQEVSLKVFVLFKIFQILLRDAVPLSIKINLNG